jgi:preprotein translocase subunit SecG
METTKLPQVKKCDAIHLVLLMDSPLAHVAKHHYLPLQVENLRGRMENVVLTIHLLLALGLVGIVLLQRSEGGGLGMGSGGDNVMSSRSAATAMSKATWVLAIAFIITSITLTIIAAQNSSDGSVLDRLGVAPAAQTDGVPELNVDELLPPSSDGTAPLLPSAD